MGFISHSFASLYSPTQNKKSIILRLSLVHKVWVVQYVVIFFFSFFLYERDITVVWEPSLNVCEPIWSCNDQLKKYSQSTILNLAGGGCLNYITALKDKLIAFMALVSIISFQICIKFFLLVCITLQMDAMGCLSWSWKLLNDLFPSHTSSLCLHSPENATCLY